MRNSRLIVVTATLLWAGPQISQANERYVISGFRKNVQGTGRPGLDEKNAPAIYIQNTIDRVQSSRSLQVQSQEDFTGCTAGPTQAACKAAPIEARATGYFYNAPGPGVMTSEYALIATVENGASLAPSQAVGLSAVGIAKRFNSSETWGLIPAIYDMDPKGSPMSGRVSVEVDNYGLGLDPFHNRIGIDVALGSPSGALPQQPGVFEAALRIGATNGDSRYGSWRQGVVLQQRFLTSIIDMSSATTDGDQIVGVGGNWTVDKRGGIAAAGFAAPLTTPASSRAPCRAGQFADDARFHYVCVGPDHWRRAALDDF